jgi:DNA-binding MarR family transcriptional regulator
MKRRPHRPAIMRPRAISPADDSAAGRRAGARMQMHDYVPQLMNRVMAGLNSRALKDFSAIGTTTLGARILTNLLRFGAMRTSRLGALSGLDRTALSHLLAGMERRGLVERARVKSDNRAVEVSLTARGRAAAYKCHAAGVNHEALLMDGVPHSHIELVRAVLARMLDNVVKRDGTTNSAPAMAAAQKRAWTPARSVAPEKNRQDVSAERQLTKKGRQE